MSLKAAQGGNTGLQPLVSPGLPLLSLWSYPETHNLARGGNLALGHKYSKEQHWCTEEIILAISLLGKSLPICPHDQTCSLPSLLKLSKCNLGPKRDLRRKVYAKPKLYISSRPVLPSSLAQARQVPLKSFSFALVCRVISHWKGILFLDTYKRDL